MSQRSMGCLDAIVAALAEMEAGDECPSREKVRALTAKHRGGTPVSGRSLNRHKELISASRDRWLARHPQELRPDLRPEPGAARDGSGNRAGGRSAEARLAVKDREIAELRAKVASLALGESARRRRRSSVEDDGPALTGKEVIEAMKKLLRSIEGNDSQPHGVA